MNSTDLFLCKCVILYQKPGITASDFALNFLSSPVCVYVGV